MSRARIETILTLVAAGMITALLARYGNRLLDKVDSNYGWRPNPEGVAEFLQELDAPYFAQAAADAMEKVEKKDTFLYRAVQHAHKARYGKPFVVGRQGIGDCIAWGAAAAVYTSESVSYELGNLPEPPLMPVEESIYGGSRVEARGRDGNGNSPVCGYSDGSYGGAAARWLRDWGVVYRQAYPDLGYDLTSYSAARAKEYGAFGNGGQGDRGRLDALARKHPARHVAAVRTWDELAAAITAGFPVTVASNQGFASVTDTSGILAPSGVWMHQMAVVGIRFRENTPPGKRAVDAALLANSWGTSWLQYTGRYPDDQPAGYFWAERHVIERMLAQGDSYAIGDIKTGFVWRDIHHGDWLQPQPESDQ